MANNFEMAVRFALMLNGETPKTFSEKAKLSQQYFTMLIQDKRKNRAKKKEIWDALFIELVGDEDVGSITKPTDY